MHSPRAGGKVSPGQGAGQGYVPGTGERALDWLHTTRPPALYVRTPAHTRGTADRPAAGPGGGQ
jgi:hypothetical protein